MSKTKDVHFFCEPRARVEVGWGTGGSVEVCSLGSNAQACKQDWSSLDYAARRIAHATTPFFRKLSDAKLKGAMSPRLLAKYAENISEVLMADEFDLGHLKDSAALQLFFEKAIWELVKIFYVDEVDISTSIAQALSSWLRKFHILFADSSAPPLLSEVDRLKASETPDGDAAYWPLLQKVTALGWVQEAYDLLTSHSVFATSYADQLRKPNLKAQYDAIDHLARLLAKYPLWTSLTGEEGSIGCRFNNRSDFLAEREVWLAEVTEQVLENSQMWQKVDLHSRPAAEGLQQVVALVCGYPEAAAEATSTWLEFLVAQLQHGFPGLTVRAGLPSLLDRSLGERGASDGWQLSTLQQLLEAVCDDAVQSIVQICSEGFFPWLLAHIPDMLMTRTSSRSVLERILPHLGCTQVEFYLLEYAAALSSGATTWELAFDYFAQCPHYGEPSAVALIESMSHTDDSRLAQKLPGICAKFGLLDTRAAVYEAQGQRCLQAGKVGEALSWLLQMDNLVPAHAAAASIVLATTDDASQTIDRMSQLADLEQLLSKSLDAQGTDRSPLSFLKHYLLLVQGMKSPKDRPKVSEALIHLMESDFSMITPSFNKQSSLLLDLLFQAIPLLEQIPPLFTLAEVDKIRTAQHRTVKQTSGGEAKQAGCKRQAVCLAVERLAVRVHLHQAD